MDLPILVVTWNGAEKIARWLESMKNIIQPLRFQPKPIIIDNGSCDKTPTIIRKEIESGFIEEKTCSGCMKTWVLRRRKISQYAS